MEGGFEQVQYDSHRKIQRTEDIFTYILSFKNISAFLPLVLSVFQRWLF